MTQNLTSSIPVASDLSLLNHIGWAYGEQKRAERVGDSRMISLEWADALASAMKSRKSAVFDVAEKMMRWDGRQAWPEPKSAASSLHGLIPSSDIAPAWLAALGREVKL